MYKVELRRRKKEKWSGDVSRVGAGEELGRDGALVAARGWGTLSGGLRCPGQARGYGRRPRLPCVSHKERVAERGVTHLKPGPPIHIPSTLAPTRYPSRS